jgi:hypothetical protein
MAHSAQKPSGANPFFEGRLLQKPRAADRRTTVPPSRQTRLDRLVTSRSATSKAAIKLRVYLLKGRPAVSLVPSGKRVTSVSLRMVNY